MNRIIGRMAAFVYLICLFSPSEAVAFDNGEYRDVPPNVRHWFKSVRNPYLGVLCCDVADGHRTTWRVDEKTGGYEVLIEGAWIPVPPHAIVRDSGNPTGEAIVWYSHVYEQLNIRCFVPQPDA